MVQECTILHFYDTANPIEKSYSDSKDSLRLSFSFPLDGTFFWEKDLHFCFYGEKIDRKASKSTRYLLKRALFERWELIQWN